MGSASKNNDPPESERLLDSSTEQTLLEFEALVAELAKPHYVFRLYVAGTSARSLHAIKNVRNICDKYLKGRYELEVVDVYQQPTEVSKAQVVAVPTLIKELPFPPKRFVGDMSNTERIAVALNLNS